MRTPPSEGESPASAQATALWCAERPSLAMAEEFNDDKMRAHRAHMRVTEALRDSRLEAAKTKTDLAADLDDQGEYEKATVVLKEALTIYQELRHERHRVGVELAATYDLLATVYKHQGKHEMALEQCQKCLVVGIKTMGWDHRDMAARYGNIGSVLLSLGKHEMALEQFEKCRAVQIKTLGTENSSLAATHGNIGSVYWIQSKHEQALAEYTLSVAIYSKLCLVFDDEVKFERALSEYKQCLDTLSAKVRQDASKSTSGAAGISISKWPHRAFSAEQVPVSAYGGSSKNVKDQQG
ncbi:hypothetical protein T484DRAFT_1854992 [Baffinella frigidus]|nr:hypothetical protein T484DRAFT_1854992 [Cryptophyta sp. CCMP2293]